MADSKDANAIIENTSAIVASQLANIQIHACEYFDVVVKAVVAIQHHTCAAALFCTTHTATDTFVIPRCCISLR